MPRTKPLSRDTIVPAAITALEESSDRESAPWSPDICGWGLAVVCLVARSPGIPRRQRWSRMRSVMRRTIITARSVPPAMMMYQISRPTWLVRRLKVSGVPAACPSVVTGEMVTSWTPTPLVTRSRRVVRWPGSMLTGSGVAIRTWALSARARRPTVIGCFRPLTSVTVKEPEPPESVTKSVPVT